MTPTQSQRTWAIEPHTRAKHDILRRYLGAWFPILGSRSPRVVYIDGFSGPGRYEGGEPGSPIIALREALKHSQRLRSTKITFLFVDESIDRITQLARELSGFPTPPHFDVNVRPGASEQEIRNLLDELDGSAVQTPVFAFLDPFGFKGLPFHLVRRLLARDRSEVLVNIMADSVNRFLEHPKDRIRQHIVELFGTEDVLRIADNSRNRIAELRHLYQKQLSTSARFVRHFEMKDDKGRVIYYLFFASNHRLGHVRMKEAFWKVDPASGFSFSDATNPRQLVLFAIDQAPSLAEHLAAAYAKQSVSVESVMTFVEDTTAYVDTHVRGALRLLEDQGRLVLDRHKLDGTPRRQHSYPGNAVVRFV